MMISWTTAENVAFEAEDDNDGTENDINGIDNNNAGDDVNELLLTGCKGEHARLRV